jgi:hypothetical protein
MSASKLRVRARSGLPSNHDAAAQDSKRIICHRYVEHPDAGNKWAWAPTNEVEEISNRVEHRALIKDGALWAADEATAREVWGPKEWRANFDASFGTAPQRPSRTAALYAIADVALPEQATDAPLSAEEKS